MTQSVCTVVLDPAQREHLWALAKSRTAPVRQVQRARIVLAAGDGTANATIARQLQVSLNTVRTWRGRFVGTALPGWLIGPRQDDPPYTAPMSTCGSWPP